MNHSWGELTHVFGRIGLMSFGGPAAQIAVMHRELVEERPLLTEQQFLSALSFCMLLPGPEAMQLATYSGWRLRGVAGGLLAGLMFVLPGALVMAILAVLYTAYGQVPFVEAVFIGIKATVIVVVIQALFRLAKKSLKATDRWVIALLSFIAIFGFAVPFPAIVIMAGLYGALRADPREVHHAQMPDHPATVRTVAIWLTLWWAPIALLWASGAERLTEIGLFFSKLAVVTFGGAYAVLAYMTQRVVSDYGWVTTEQMMDGLGLAETTPGPLILVTEFIGYLAGFGAAGVAGGIAAILVTLWVTFVPSFLWIFAGAPYLDWIASRPRLSGALSTITAAVVGVILNLSLWFAMHVLFAKVSVLTAGQLSLTFPRVTSLDPIALGLAVLAAVCLFLLRLGLPLVLAVTGIAGAIIFGLG